VDDIKNLPNIISIFRIVLSIVLVFISKNAQLFLAAYLVCGLSDVADGFIARKYHLDTPLGAKLDSLADFIFLTASLYRMIVSYNLNIPIAIVLWGLFVAVIRVLNFCITKVKFKQWGILHTIGNKLTGLMIFFVCPLAILTGQISPAIVIIPVLSAFEEMIILLASSEYNPNVKSIIDRYRTTISCNATIQRTGKGVSAHG